MATLTFSPPLSLPVPPQHYCVIAVSAAHRDHRRGLRAADPAFDAYCRALETATQAPIQPESTACVSAPKRPFSRVE
jgi:hypothetical protein